MRVVVKEDGLLPIDDGSGRPMVVELMSDDEDVRPLVRGVPMRPELPPQVPPRWIADFPVLVEADHDCNQPPGALPVRFVGEITGPNGFRDRFLLTVPQACTPPPGGSTARPEEVPRTMTLSKLGNIDMAFEWEPVPGPDPATYNVWRGHLTSLRSGEYDHSVEPFDTVNPESCRLTATSTILVGDAAPSGLSSRNFYYLVTAETACPGTGVANHGSPGFAFRGNGYPFGEADLERPMGVIRALECLP